jgi:hypothetical protein
MQPTHMQAQKKVSGIHYPAGRDELIDYARAHGADRELLECMRHMPNRIYRTQGDVGHAFAQANGC